VLAQRGGGEGVAAEVVVSQRRAPGLQLPTGRGDLSLGPVEVAPTDPHLRQAHLGQVAVQMVLLLQARQEPAEQPFRGDEVSLPERDSPAVIRQRGECLLSAAMPPSGPLRGVELAGCLGPVALSHRHAGELLASDHLVFQLPVL